MDGFGDEDSPLLQQVLALKRLQSFAAQCRTPSLCQEGMWLMLASVSQECTQVYFVQLVANNPPRHDKITVFEMNLEF